MSLTVSNSDIAIKTGVPIEIIQRIKQTNTEQYNILRLAALCGFLNLDRDDLQAMHSLKQLELKT